jgi:uncharacterized protein involved in exopolysaccharide biosynthesis
MSNSEQTTVDQPATQDLHIEAMESRFARARMFARLRLVWNGRRFLLRCASATLLVATLVAFLIPKQFESTAQLMPPDNQSSGDVALLRKVAGSPGIDMGSLVSGLMGMQSSGALFVGILQSRTVRDRIVAEFHLKEVYGKSLQEKAREKLAERTAIAEDRKSGIISITVTDRDAHRAAAMASAYVDELNALILQLSTSSAHRERVFLEDRLSTVKQDLDLAERDFSHFASSEGAIDITEQGKAMVEAAAALEGQLIAAQSELEGLKQIYTDQNLRVRSTQARIDGLRQQLKKLAGRGEETAADGVEKTSDAPYLTLRQLPILGVPYADKLRRMKVEEAVFETLTKQYELAKVEEAKEIPSVKVLDAPIVPDHKSFPPRLIIMIFGTLLGVAVGTICVFSRAHWQEIDPLDPGKVLAQEIFRSFAARLPGGSRNGAGERLPASKPAVEKESPQAAKSARASGRGGS